jgi:uncharacterized protein (TIGR02646 family)
MRYIKKGSEAPYHLEQARLKNLVPLNPEKAWKNFAYKEELCNYFLEPTQYYICAYCEISLNELGKHIEHIKPKSQYPEETFNHQNLVLSCIDDKQLNNLPRYNHSCGHYKLNNYDPLLFISPSEPNCQDYFWYRQNGEVIPHPNLTQSQQERARYTIDLLNLNNLRLVRRRRILIEETIIEIDKLLDDLEALHHFADCDLSLTNNRLQAFHSVRLQYFGRIGEEIIEQSGL